MGETLADLVGGTPGHAPATATQKKVIRGFAKDLRIASKYLDTYIGEVLEDPEATIDTITKRDASIVVIHLQKRKNEWRATR